MAVSKILLLDVIVTERPKIARENAAMSSVLRFILFAIDV
jgi:hypothetical protein